MIHIRKRCSIEEMPIAVKILSGKFTSKSIVLLLLFLLTVSPVQTAKAVQSETRPQKSRWRGEWLAASPSLQGFDADRLEKAVRQIGEMNGVYSFILVRNGYIVVERYFREGHRNKPHNLKSASKSVVSMLIGIAIEDGYLSLDQPVAELFPPGKFLNDPSKGRITVRHLLTMTSGLDPTSYDAYNIWISNQDWVAAALDRSMISEPGTRYQYSTGDSHILSGVLTSATGMSTQEFAERELFDPLGIKVQGWATDPNGTYQGGNNLSLIPRDMAKLGQLYLDGGRFGNRQVVPEWWVDESTRSSDLGPHEVYGNYGFSWYVNPGGKDAFVAVGFGGQYIYVSPVHDCVIVVTSTLQSKGRAWEKMLFEQLQTGVLGGIEIKEKRPIYTAGGDDPEGPRDVSNSAILPANAPGSKTATPGGDEGPLEKEPGSDRIISQRMGQATTSIILRSEPNRKSSKIGVVDSGELLVILETEGKWHRVHSRNRDGWIYGNYVRLQSGASRDVGDHGEKPESLTGITAQPPAESDLSQAALLAVDNLKTKSVRTKTRLNLRAGPGKTYAVIHSLKPSTNVTVMDEDGLWLRVQAGRYEGWVHRDYVTTESLPESEQVALKTEAPETAQMSAVSTPETKPSSDAVGVTQVKTDFNALQDRVGRIGHRLDASEKGHRQVDEDFDSIRQSLKIQQEMTARAEEARKRLESELAGAHEEIAKLNQVAQTEQSGREKLNKDLASASLEIATLKTAVETALAGRERLITELVAARQDMGGLQKELQESRAAREKLAVEVTGLGRELKGQKEASATSEAARVVLSTELTGARQEIAKLNQVARTEQSGREKLNKDLASARLEIATLKTAVETAQAGRENLGAELAAVLEGMSGLQKELQESRAAREKLGVEVAGLGRELKGKKEAAATSEAAGAALSTELAGTRQEIEKLNSAAQTALAGQDQLSMELVAARQDMGGLQKELQESRAAREKLAVEVTGLGRELKGQKEASATSEAARVVLSTELTGARQEIEKLNAAAQTAEAGRDQLSMELVAARQDMGGLQKKLQESRAAREKLGTEVTRLDEDLKTRKVAAAKVEATGAALNTELAASRKEIEKLNATAQTAQVSRELLSAELAGAREEIAKLNQVAQTEQSGREKLSKDLASSRLEIGKLTAAVQTGQAGREQLGAELVAARQEIEGLQKELQESFTSRKKLDADVRALRRELEDQLETAVELKTDRKSLESTLASARRQIESLKKSLSNSGKRNENNIAELTGIHLEFDKQRKKTGHLESMQKTLASELSSARKQIDRLEWELKRTRESRKNMLAGINQMQQEIDRLSRAESSVAQAGQARTGLQGRTTDNAPRESSKLTSVSESDTKRSPGNPSVREPNAAPVDEFVKSWAAAWARKDVAGYLSHYSSKFQHGSGKSRDEWRRQRKKRLEGPAFIEVEVDGIEKTVTGDRRAIVTFQQEYRSDGYVDRVIKTLDLMWEDNGWKIIKETIRPVK